MRIQANAKRIQANGDRMQTNKKLIYPELSYKLMGVLFKVQSKLGPRYQEKYYQRAIAIELGNQGILFERERLVPLNYEKEKIGKYFIDFVIDNKIALEIKSVDYFHRDFTSQVLAYLHAANLKLGIIANFNSEKLCYRRIVNPGIRSSSLEIR